MALIPGICSQCGATLSVDAKKDAMVCPYCKTPFIVEKAIQNFNNTYNITNNITAQNVIVQQFERDFDIVGGVLRKYKGESVNVVIPNGVSSIGTGAFENTMIVSVTMPDDVINIQERAFYCCIALKEISFSQNLISIGAYAFSYCEKLLQVIFPDKLESIGEHAFTDCNSLQEVSFPQSLIELSSRSFCNCIKLTQTVLPDYLEIVGDSVFEGCINLKRAYLPMCLLNEQENIGRIFASSSSYPPIGCPKLLNIYIDDELLKEDDELYAYFPYTKFGERKIRRNECRCQYCGGEFIGIPFLKYCEKCGKRKDY